MRKKIITSLILAAFSFCATAQLVTEGQPANNAQSSSNPSSEWKVTVVKDSGNVVASVKYRFRDFGIESDQILRVFIDYMDPNEPDPAIVNGALDVDNSKPTVAGFIYQVQENTQNVVFNFLNEKVAGNIFSDKSLIMILQPGADEFTEMTLGDWVSQGDIVAERQINELKEGATVVIALTRAFESDRESESLMQTSRALLQGAVAQQ